MGTFHQRIELAAGPSGPFEALDALVDSGATYTLVPRAVLTRLGVAPVDQQTFVIADGSQVLQDIGEATVRIDGRTRTTVVVFGDDAAEPLLGAVTVESFGLGIDPLGRQLIPMPGYLVGLRAGAPRDS